MPATDRQSLVQLTQRLKLVTAGQVEECQAELGGSRDEEALLSALERKSYLTALQIDKLRKGDTAGYFLGSYRLLYKIASGSFGRVYRADEPSTGRVVAIKVLRNRHSENPDVIEAFEREGRVGMSLRHPNIVEILSVGQDPITKQYYIVMEFVEGGNLRDILAIRKQFEVPEGLKILEDIAAALAYAFARGVTHRDMKLTNVLISAQGTAKVVDFGLAQIFSKTFIAEDDNVGRSVDYIGLERATNAPPNDVRSDIYFIGCVGYEILSGRPPLTLTKNIQERKSRERFLRVRPLMPHELKGTPTQVAHAIRLVETMMAIDPNQRYQTPTQLLDAIRSLRAETAGKDSLNSAGPRTAPSVFILESDERLQDAFREKIKNMGYRVLIASDPSRAIERYQMHPFHVLIVDADTTLRDGVRSINAVLQKARAQSLTCHGIVILDPKNDEMLKVLDPTLTVTVLHRPLKLGALAAKLREIAPITTK
jgi:serine/threonine protein kinase